MTLIRLPNLENPQHSPCDLMYRYACKRMGRNWDKFHKKYSVSDFFVCQATFDILEAMEKKWAWEHYDKKFMGKKYFERAWNIYWHLDVSPVVDDSVPRGKVRFGR